MLSDLKGGFYYLGVTTYKEEKSKSNAHQPKFIMDRNGYAFKNFKRASIKHQVFTGIIGHEDLILKMIDRCKKENVLGSIFWYDVTKLGNPTGHRIYICSTSDDDRAACEFAVKRHKPFWLMHVKEQERIIQRKIFKEKMND